MNIPLHRLSRPVRTATLDQSVADAASTMREHHVGCVVIVREGRPVGMLTDRDLAVRVVAEGRDAVTTKVSDVVTYDPIVVRDTDEVVTLLSVMRAHGIRRVPVVDQAGQLVGIVTADDITLRVGRELAALADAIEAASDAEESR